MIYYIKITLYQGNSDIFLWGGGLKKVVLPYNYWNFKARVVCSIKGIFNIVIKQYLVKYNINSKNHEYLTVVLVNQICGKNPYRNCRT